MLSTWMQERRQGYKLALDELGLSPMDLLTIPPPRDAKDRDSLPFDEGSRHCAGWLIEVLNGSAPVDAILACNDPLAAWLMGACRLLERTPHRDVTVVGYDNTWAALSPEVRGLQPPAATMDRLNHECGRRMIQVLSDRLAGTLGEVPAVHHIAPTLIVPTPDKTHE